MNTKGVSPLVGFILTLAIIMGFIGLLQSMWVPQWNKAVEAEHFDGLSYQAARIGEVVTLSASTGKSNSVVLKAGLKYPTRPFLISPPLATSTISTKELTISVSGDDLNFDEKTYAIIITPNYYYSQNSELIYEHTAVFSKYGSQKVPISEQSSFTSGSVDIYLINATFNSMSVTQPVNLIFEPVSYGGKRFVDSAQITFTTYDNETVEYWYNWLSEIYGADKISKNGNQLTVEVSNTYLSVTYLVVHASTAGKVAANAVSNPYSIMKVNPLSEYTVLVNDSVVLGVKVADKYGNPVPGVEVYIDATKGYIDKTTARTDDKGEVYVSFIAQSEGDGFVRFTCPNCSASKTLEYTIRVNTIETPAGATGPYEIEWEKDEYVLSFGTVEIQKSITMKACTNPRAVNVSVEFATDHSTSIAWFEPSRSQTDDTGNVTTTLTVKPDWSDWLRVIKAYVTTFAAGDTALVKVYKTLTWVVDAYDEFVTGVWDNVTIHGSSGEDGHLTLEGKEVSNWLTGWTYRREVNITENSGSDLTDYQVLVELTPSNFDFSKAKSDGSDIRFTDSDGVTKLNYWIEEWSSNRALIWVKVPSIAANSVKTIYLYYGNQAAESESSGVSTFDFFDDFEDGDISDWTGVDATIQATTFNGKNVLKLTPGTATYYKHLAIPANCNLNLDSYVLESYIYDENSAGSVVFHYKDDGNWWSLELYVGGNRDIFRPYLYNIDFGWVYTHTPVSISNNQWYRIKVNVFPDRFEMYINNELKWSRSVSWWYQFSDYTKVGLVEHSGFGPLYADWIFVRKYASQEPSVSVGSEESTNYVSQGTYRSEVKDLAYNSSIIVLDWSGVLPAGTEVEFYIRASNSSFDINDTSPSWIFVGRASDGNQFDLQSLNIVGRFAQWRVLMTTSDETKTPTIDQVTVGYNPT
jgi:hypothetical protein